MSIVVPTCGQLLLLNHALIDSNTPLEDYTLKLYQNNHAPTTADTAANYTAATFTGSTPKTLTRAGWGATAVIGGKASSTYADQAFMSSDTTPQTIYGYFVVGATTATLLWAEAFSSPHTVGNGDELIITPVFTLTTMT